MAVPFTLQQKILTSKDNYNMFGLEEEDVKIAEEGEENVLLFAVGEVIRGLLEVVELRENDRYWMDNPRGIRCHEEWDTKNKQPMKDIHFERYMESYSIISNETTIIGCLGGERWGDRDQDEWCCEKCWKIETQIKKRNISLYGNKEWVGEGVGREDYLCHTYDPRENRAYLTCNSCQEMIEAEVEKPDIETEMCVECGICDLMCDDIGLLKGRFTRTGQHDLDGSGIRSFFYNGDNCPTCVKKREELYKSLFWRSGRTVEDYFSSGWLIGERGDSEWKPITFTDTSDDDLELTSDEDDEDDEERTYRGEYENVESDEEESSRSALEIMNKVKDIGEILFDYQEQIKEGDYLKICNLLQGIVKDSNTL